MRGLLVGATIAVLAILTGCDSTRDFNVEHHALGTSETLATDASARLVTATPVVGAVDSTGRFKPHQINCAEPSPDVAKAIEAAFSSGVSIDVSGQTADMPADLQAKLANSLAQSRSEALAQLTERLPTIQLLRDGLFRACEAYANGTLSPISYSLVLSRYGDTLVTMLGSELIAGTYGHQLASLGGTADSRATASVSAPTAAADAATTTADGGVPEASAGTDGATENSDGTASPNGLATSAATRTVATATAVQGNALQGNGNGAAPTSDPQAAADRAKVQAELVEAYLAMPSPSALMTACITAMDRAPGSVSDGQSPFAAACVDQPGNPGLLQQSLQMMRQQIDAQRQVLVDRARQTSARQLSLVDQVIAAQAELKRRGLYTGTADGLAAGKTIEAIRKFQSANGLAPTGQLDPTTLQLLLPQQG